MRQAIEISANWSLRRDRNFIAKMTKPVEIRLANDRTAKAKQVQNMDQFIAHIEGPLGNQIQALRSYLKWVVHRYATQGILRLEDINSRTIPAIRKFANLKNKKILQQKGLPDNLDQYKGLKALEEMVRQFDEVKGSDRQLEHELIEKKEVQIVYNDANYKIVSPKTERASCYYGRNTEWCTAASKAANGFDHYNNDGPLYIFLDKRRNRRWQLHWNGDQLRSNYDDDSLDIDDDEFLEDLGFSFMDENDEPVSLRGIPSFLRRYPVLPRVFNTPKHFPIYKPKTRQELEQVIRNYQWSAQLSKQLPKQLQMDLFDYGRKLSPNPHPEVKQRMLERGISQQKVDQLSDCLLYTSPSPRDS